MKTKFLKSKSIILTVMIIFLLVSNYCLSQSTDDNWWTEITKEHKIRKRDYQVIEQAVIFSDSISDKKDFIYFNYPVCISKGNDNYYIYSVDSIVFNKSDSIVNFYNGISVGFVSNEEEKKPISISEFNKLIYKMKENLMLSIDSNHSFSWSDQEYFSKKNYNVGVRKTE